MIKGGWIVGFAALLAACACSGSDPVLPDAGGVDGALDAGEVEDAGAITDAGLLDTGRPDLGPRPPRICSLNPFDCAEDQVMSESCRCLPECAAPLLWNPNLFACVTPPVGACHFDSDCPIQGDVCLDFPNNGPIARCEDTATCACAIPCNPFVRRENAGCPANNAQGELGCTWIGDPLLPQGLCLGTGPGARQATPCPRGNECNRQGNFFCIGGGEGLCARLCDVADQQLCNDLGDYDCVDLQNEDLPGIGVCREPLPPVFDLGQSCTSSASCDGALCSQILAGSCSFGCGGLISCPSDSLCVTFTGANLPPGEESICMPTCDGPTAIGDGSCRSKNPNLICRQLIAEPAPALCSPPCTFIGCAPTTTCNTQSGRCE